VEQETMRVFIARKRDTDPGKCPQFSFGKVDRRVTVYYFYLWDEGFGPAFIKVCTYERGLAALDPRWAGGRPRQISSDDEASIVQAATTRPAKLGRPFTHWSIRKLVGYLADNPVRTGSIRGSWADGCSLQWFCNGQQQPWGPKL
jgi:hypothetical protein